jgi:hypothetical protein
MRLQQRLSERKKSFLANGRATPEMLGIMQRSTEQLRSSGIPQKMLKVGQKAPSFELPNEDGQVVASTSLLTRGPLVISYFRGVW